MCRQPPTQFSSIKLNREAKCDSPLNHKGHMVPRDCYYCNSSSSETQESQEQAWRRKKTTTAMGCRSCDKPKMNYRKGLWSPEEDQRLRDYILKHGLGCWSAVPAKAGEKMLCFLLYFHAHCCLPCRAACCWCWILVSSAISMCSSCNTMKIRFEFLCLTSEDKNNSYFFNCKL